jgi:hypothetical protein
MEQMSLESEKSQSPTGNSTFLERTEPDWSRFTDKRDSTVITQRRKQ